MSVQGSINDADADIAALVYSRGDRPDLVLCDFARHLAGTGRRICGLVQFRDGSFDRAYRRVLILDDWRMIDVSRKAVEEKNCHIDGHWVDCMGARIQTLIRGGVDAVIVNRFGPLEVAGRGFCDAIRVASVTETPLVIAVPKAEFERWTRFTNGMTVRLDCARDRVLGWWHRISTRSSHLPELNPRTCELFK